MISGEISSASLYGGGSRVRGLLGLESPISIPYSLLFLRRTCQHANFPWPRLASSLPVVAHSALPIGDALASYVVGTGVNFGKCSLFISTCFCGVASSRISVRKCPMSQAYRVCLSVMFIITPSYEIDDCLKSTLVPGCALAIDPRQSQEVAQKYEVCNTISSGAIRHHLFILSSPLIFSFVLEVKDNYGLHPTFASEYFPVL